MQACAGDTRRLFKNTLFFVSTKFQSLEIKDRVTAQLLWALLGVFSFSFLSFFSCDETHQLRQNFFLAVSHCPTSNKCCFGRSIRHAVFLLFKRTICSYLYSLFCFVFSIQDSAVARDMCILLRGTTSQK